MVTNIYLYHIQIKITFFTFYVRMSQKFTLGFGEVEEARGEDKVVVTEEGEATILALGVLS